MISNEKLQKLEELIVQSNDGREESINAFRAACSPETVYGLITTIRNLRQELESADREC